MEEILCCRTSPLTPLTPWEMETRQTVANVINGIRKENAALLQLSRKTPPEHHHPMGGSSGAATGEGGENSDSAFYQHQSHSGSYQKKSRSSRRKSSSTSLKKERPRSVGDLLRRINLEVSNAMQCRNQQVIEKST